MLRQGRFKHRLLDETFLKTHARAISKALAPFIDSWSRKVLSDYDMAGIYILIFSLFRRPKDFLGGPHNLLLPSHENAFTGEKLYAQLKPVLPQELVDAKSLRPLINNQPFLHQFCSHSWRSIPFSVQRSLSSWSAGNYPLILMTTIPSAEEVLHMQAQGTRCVTMLSSENDIANFIGEGRDVFGFLIHDLIHADHFFFDPKKAAAQIEFCKKLVKVHELPFIQQMLSTDDKFCDEMHYLMSDMNSVPLHLLKTLKALLLGYFKRKNGGDFQIPLPENLEKEFSHSYSTILSFWNFSDGALAAAFRLNTPYYLHPEDSVLLDHELTILPGGRSDIVFA